MKFNSWNTSATSFSLAELSLGSVSGERSLRGVVDPASCSLMYFWMKPVGRSPALLGFLWYECSQDWMSIFSSNKF